ncbi:MAG: terpene cyclase/mutase family protein [Planctomycetaceae bacterium]|nr:terpene cyclase/mutase family protein [Planctomycetaceae bacterium]
MSTSAPTPEPSPKAAPKRRRKSMRQLVEEWSWQRRLWREAKNGWKGVLASVVFHAILLFLMTLFIVTAFQEEPQMLYLSWGTAVEEEPEVITPDVEPIRIPSLSMNNSPSRETPDPQPEQEAAPATEPKPAVRPVNVSAALANRPRRSLGSPSPNANDLDLREALDRATAWIAQQQYEDGHWSLNGPYPDAGSIQTSTGATSLALLALLGDGHTHVDGEYKSQVDKGLRWLIRQQRPSGDLFDILEEGREPHFYAHAQGTIALCEALALTGDESLRAPAERAVQFLVDAQNPVQGGWKYRPLTETGIGDLSVTGWALMALHTARMAKIPAPLEVYMVSDRFLDSVQEQQLNRSLYKYRPDFPVDESQRMSMTAEGLLCRQWLGWEKNDPAMKRGVDFLVSTQNRPEWLAHRRNVYAWYYTAQTLHNLGGSRWEKWFAEVQHLILKHQATAGPTRGSWHPSRPPGAFQERSHDAGRLYLTVMCVLILETPHRHQPVYAEEPSPMSGGR